MSFFVKDTATTEFYTYLHTLALHDALPISAGVAPRLGHSVDVLMRGYAGVFDDERDRSNALIDKALRASAGPSTRTLKAPLPVGGLMSPPRTPLRAAAVHQKER